jgi:hypothetical protein
MNQQRVIPFVAIVSAFIVVFVMIVKKNEDRPSVVSNMGRILDSYHIGPFSVMNGTLMFTEPLSVKHGNSAVDESGFLSGILSARNYGDKNNNSLAEKRTFSVDVGINLGEVILNDWLLPVPHMFVIGIEANHRLVRNFENLEAFRPVSHRALLIPAAVSTKPGLATFNTGSGWEGNRSETGSLFGWSDKKKEKIRLRSLEYHQTVRLIKLSDILQHVPPPHPPHFLWDTLKVDAQGGDVDVIISAGDYLSNFICIVAELEYGHYDVPADIPRDPAPFLSKYNYTKIAKVTNNEVRCAYVTTACRLYTQA